MLCLSTVNKLDHLNEIDKLLERNKLPKLTQEQFKILNGTIKNEDSKLEMKIFPQINLQLDGFKHLRTTTTNSFLKRGNTEASTTLITERDIVRIEKLHLIPL